jgi:hypothetical protein
VNAPQTARFGHVDLSDTFIRRTNLVMCFFISWGASMFFLILGACPAGLAFTMLRSLLPTPLPGISEDTLVGGAVTCWMGLSIPIAIFRVWLRYQRLRHNRVVIGPDGLEVLWFPRQVRFHSWASIAQVQYREPLEVDEGTTVELIVHTDRGRVVLAGEDWPTGEISSAIRQYTQVTTIH